MAVVFSGHGSLRSRLFSDLPIPTPPTLPPPAAFSFSPSSDQDNDSQDATKPRLPKRRYRWQPCKGDGPGEYGGPPLDFRIRRMWGKPAKDPLNSTDDYIWKKEWQSQLVAAPSKEPPRETDAEVGFLSLNRAIALDSIDVDLSQELLKPPKSILQLQVEALRDGRSTDEVVDQDKPRWRMAPAPTKREQKKWKRASKAAGVATSASENEAQANQRAGSTTARQKYLSLKKKLQLLTAVFGVAGAAVAYVSYSTEVAVSYGIGLLGALAYIRMLGNSVDAVGKKDAEGAIRGALAQPRLLVPVVLVMLFNRWNDLLAVEHGFVHLQLMPMLVGFFTYKAATIAEVLGDILQGAEGKKI